MIFPSTSTRRQILLASLAAMAPAMPASAQDAPAPSSTRPIRVVVGAAPGGPTDIIARFIADRLTTLLGQPVMVDNRPGASGNLAGEYVLQQPADGTTLMLAAGGILTINPVLIPSPGFNPERDMAGVAAIASAPMLLTIHPGLPVRSVQELIAYGRRPGARLAFGSSGIGGGVHLAGELFRLLTGLDMVHVPYRGSGPMLTDLIGGTLQLAFDSLPSSIGAARSGQLRALAVTAAERWSTTPELPTMIEAGLPGFVVESWFGLTARKDLPAPIMGRLSRAVTDVLAMPEAQARLGQLGAAPMHLATGAFDTFIGAERVRWGNLIQQAGIRPD